MSKICDTCETAIHCAKYGCIPERIGSKPAQEFICSTGLCHYRKPLTNEQIYSVLENLQVMYNRPPTTDSRIIFARAIEAAHGIKENT